MDKEKKVTKKQAALEVARASEVTVKTAMAGVFMVFLSAVGGGVNFVVGSIFAGIGAVILGYYGFKAYTKLQYLKMNYLK